MKTCSKCKCQKPADLKHFSPHKKTKDKLHCWCRKCVNEYSKKRYKKNRTTIIEQNKKYAKTPNGRKASRKASRTYYYKHKNDESYRSYYTIYNKKHGNRLRRKYFEKNPDAKVLANIRARCGNKNRPEYQNIKCLLKWSEFKILYRRTNTCELCGQVLNDTNRNAPDGRTIDRINPDGHYEVKNCRILCRSCNSRLARPA